MDFEQVVRELRDEASRLNRAADVLEQGTGGVTDGRKRGRRTMSVSARRRIAAAQKARWAKQKQKMRTKKTPKGASPKGEEAVATAS